MAVTVVSHYTLECCDLFKVDADDAEAMSDSMFCVIILSTVKYQKGYSCSTYCTVPDCFLCLYQSG